MLSDRSKLLKFADTSNKNRNNMKKITTYLFALMFVSATFMACDDQFAGQYFADPTENEQGSKQIGEGFELTLGSDFATPIELNVEAVAEDVPFVAVRMSQMPAILSENAEFRFRVELSDTEDFENVEEVASTTENNAAVVSAADLAAVVTEFFGRTPATHQMFMRVSAVLVDGTVTVRIPGQAVYAITINADFVALLPFYEVEEVFPFFIIGYNSWNDMSSGGLLDGSLIPMGVIEGDHYTLDGLGTFVFTGYFEAGRQFKIIRDNWGGPEFSNDGGHGIDNPVFGGGGNFVMPTSGYWTITLNSITNTLAFEPATITPQVFNNMGVVGTINNWGGDPDIAMTPVFSTGNNHIWRLNELVIVDDEQQVKFRYNQNWDVNWGVATANAPLFFPQGIAVRGHDNIRPTAGTFVVFFNDIDGSFIFINR